MAKHSLRKEFMWYVIQVCSGREEYARDLIEKYKCQEYIEACRIPLFVRLRKQGNIWYPETKVLFPGYLFVKTENAAELYEHLRVIPRMTRLLGTGKEIVPITAQEEKFLVKIGGDDLVVGMSKGIIEQKQIKIMSGPLRNMEGSIRRIDRHKRLAWVSVKMFGREMEIPLGLEVLQVL